MLTITRTLLTILLGAGVCAAQQTQSSFAWRTRLPSDPEITQEQRLKLFLRNNLFSVGAVMRTLGPAVGNQISDRPPEWDRSAGGFGHRLGAQFAMQASRGAIGSASAAWLGLDPRYQRCDCSGFGRRLGHAVSGFVLSGDGSGKRRFDPSNILSAMGSGYAGASLYPSRYDVAVKGYQLGARQGLQIGMQNVMFEFGPDLKRFFRTKILRR